MEKKNFWEKVKGFFLEEPKKHNIEAEKIELIDNQSKNNTSLIKGIIEGKNNNKEDIIEALKQCEKEYFNEGKQLEILNAIGELQNDPQILDEFIKETAKYTKYDGEKYLEIRKKREETINKIKNLQENNEEINTNKDTNTPIKEYTPVDYTTMLENQELRIINAKNKSEEEKQKLIDELYKNFEIFVGENTYNKKQDKLRK